MVGARKGITPVIAIVLLLMMTVAAAGMAYVWFTGVQEETQTSVGETMRTRTEQMAGAVVIDAVYEPGSANQVAVAVRNTGSIQFDKNISVYVGGSATPCIVNVTALGTSQVVTCTVTGGLVEGMVIRAVPPQGAASTVTCNIRGSGNAEYCIV